MLQKGGADILSEDLIVHIGPSAIRMVTITFSQRQRNKRRTGLYYTSIAKDPKWVKNVSLRTNPKKQNKITGTFPFPEKVTCF